MKNNTKSLNREPIQKYLPIIIVILYLSLTVILFAFGPWNYPVKNKFYFYFFLISVNMMLGLGYFFGMSIKENVRPNDKNGLKTLKKSMLVFIVLIPLTNYLNTGHFLFNFSSIRNLGKAYIDSLLLRQGKSAVLIISYMRIILSPYIICFLPLGLFYWDKLNKNTKILFILGVFGGLGLDFFRGTNKTFADYLIVFFMIFLEKSVIKSRNHKPSIIYPKRNRSTNLTFFLKLMSVIILIGLFFILFFIYFSNTAPKRYGVSIYGSNMQYVLDLEHPFLRLFDSIENRLAVGSLISYFTQGYYALGLAMEKPFMPTFGFGSSMAVLLNITSLFNNNFIFERTYVYRNYLINNWDWHGKWSTFYVWVASDISFIGVVFLMFIIGFAIARSWRRIIYHDDYISVIVFVQLMILCFYLPANNQLFQSFEGLVGNSFWIFMWLMKLRNDRKKAKNI